MKKKKIPTPILIELIIIAVLVVAIAVVFINKSARKNTSDQNGTQTEAVSDADAGGENTTASATTAEPTPTADTSAATWGNSYYYSAQQNSSDTSGPSVISFPYKDESSGIVIGYSDSYEGAFLEDSSDDQVYGVAVLVVQNQGSNDIELAQITLTQGDTQYYFEVSALPQGAIAVVQEKNRQSLPDSSFNTCSVVTTIAEALPMSADSVSVEETEDGDLKVTNLTDSTIPCVRVFYKYYSTEDGVYVGGITYTTKLTDLEAGQSLVVTPSHYVAGYSRVVMVRTYDTAEG